MNVMHWLIRAKQWARNPPSWGQVKLVFGVIAACLIIVGIEWLVGFPDWMAPNRLDAKP